MPYKFKFSLLAVFLAFILVTACQNEVKNPEIVNPQDLKDELAKANEHLVKVETEEIENYIRRHEWQMQTTGTGLRYLIYQKGEGNSAEMGDKVKINYKVNLITGVVCYSSEDDGPLEFETGKAEVINGLEEGILLMHQGDKAKLIIPSHLAYGLLGDDEMIPKRATLIYDIEVLDLIKPKN